MLFEGSAAQLVPVSRKFLQSFIWLWMHERTAQSCFLAFSEFQMNHSQVSLFALQVAPVLSLRVSSSFPEFAVAIQTWIALCRSKRTADAFRRRILDPDRRPLSGHVVKETELSIWAVTDL